MTLSRRSPGQIRDYAGMLGDKPDPAKLRAIMAQLTDDIRRLKLMGYGRPAPHADTHAPSGADPLDTAAPTNATGTAHSEGTAETFMRSDATIKQGIVTTKGDVLGHTTVPARVPVGTNGQALVADSAETLGVKWGVPLSAEDAELLSWIM